MSLNSLVIPGTRDEAYFIIFDSTDQAYSPYSSAYTIGINGGVVLDNYSYMTNGVSTITVMEVAA